MANGGNDAAKHFNYVNAYEGAIREVVKSCGSIDVANQLLEELHAHYEKTVNELKRVRKIYGDRQAVHQEKRGLLLSQAQREADLIIEKHAPHASDHVRELILGTSLVATAVMMPEGHGASFLAAAVKMLAIGGSYYFGFGLMRKWKAIAGRRKVASCAGMISPRHVNAHKKVGKWRAARGILF